MKCHSVQPGQLQNLLTAGPAEDALARLGALGKLTKVLGQEPQHNAFTATLLGAAASLAFEHPTNSQQVAELLTVEQIRKSCSDRLDVRFKLRQQGWLQTSPSPTANSSSNLRQTVK